MTTLRIVFSSRGKPTAAELEDQLDNLLKRAKLGLVNGTGTLLVSGITDLGVTVTGRIPETLALCIAFLRHRKAGKKTKIKVCDGKQNPEYAVWEDFQGEMAKKLEATEQIFHPPSEKIELVLRTKDRHQWGLDEVRGLLA